MRRHPELGAEILRPVRIFGGSPGVCEIVLAHHERWDGAGYPRGLRGEQIPFAARVFSVVDVYDALSSDRPYRPAWPKEKVLEYLRERSGTEFDPRVVAVFLEIAASW